MGNDSRDSRATDFFCLSGLCSSSVLRTLRSLYGAIKAGEVSLESLQGVRPKVVVRARLHEVENNNVLYPNNSNPRSELAVDTGSVQRNRCFPFPTTLLDRFRDQRNFRRRQSGRAIQALADKRTAQSPAIPCQIPTSSAPAQSRCAKLCQVAYQRQFPFPAIGQ